MNALFKTPVMYNHIIITFTLFCLSTALSAGSDKQYVNYEEKAAGILEQAGNKLKAHDAVYLEFELTSSNTVMSSYDSDGFIYAKGDMYKIKSGEIYFISDGTVSWTYLEDVNEVHISYLEDTEGALSPISLLDNYYRDYNYLWIGTEVFNNKKVHIIDLAPIDHQPFTKYRLGIDTETANVLFTIAFDRQGNTYTYTVTKMVVNPDVTDDMFTFDPSLYDDIEVIDLR